MIYSGTTLKKSAGSETGRQLLGIKQEFRYLKKGTRSGMQYAAGTPGRIFYIRFDHGEDLISELQTFIQEHQIQSGVIQLIGAVSQGKMVTGPKKTVLPPDQVWQSLDEAHELVGIAIIRSGVDGPIIHLHASVGRENSMFTGCFREDMSVYIVIEAVITEFSGFIIKDKSDKQSGLHLPVV